MSHLLTIARPTRRQDDCAPRARLPIGLALFGLLATTNVVCAAAMLIAQ